MLYTYGNVEQAPYAEYVKKAHDERARVIASLLHGAVASAGRLGRNGARAFWRAGRSFTSVMVKAHRRRAAMRELQTLSDWILKDIGISRSDIPFLVGQQMSAAAGARVHMGKDCDSTAPREREGADADALVPLRPAA